MRRLMMRRTMLAILAVVGLLPAACPSAAEEYFPPPVREVGGMYAAKLGMAFEYASRSSQHGGLLVVRHGWLVYERYWGRGNRLAIPTMASVGKAFTSITCGVMIDQKREQIPDGLDQK